MREIILDTETTGLEPSQGHRIVEIGCVEMIDKSRTGKTFHTYLNPLRDVPMEAERVHGLSTDFLSDKPLFEDVVKDFLAFVKDARLVIHNAPFDMKFINFELQKIYHAPISMDVVTDTLMMARKKFPGAQNNLDALCRRFGIDLSNRVKHGALLDAELLSEVYIELTGGKQVMFELGAQAPAQVEVAIESIGEFNAIELQPSEDELAAHAKLVETIRGSLWTAA